MAIRYFCEDCGLRFDRRRKTSAWIRRTAQAEGAQAGDISVVFCSDAYLLEINRRYLQHDYFTDIITFDYTEGGRISGDLMISVDTVRANAETFGTPFEEELDRVIIHGVLHLLGYGDKSGEEARKMRELENKYLGTRE